jgi:hypothetical protein
MYGVVLSRSQLREVLEHVGHLPEEAKIAEKTTTQWRAHDTFVVTSEFNTSDDSNLELKPGMKGIVVLVDDDGDLSVRFDGFPKKYWVTSDDFSKVEKLQGRRVHDIKATMSETKTVTVTFISGEVLEIDCVRDGTVSQDLVKTIVMDQKLKNLVVKTQLLDGDRVIPGDEVLTGTSFTVAQSIKTSEELDNAIEDDPHEVVGQLATALGLDYELCPHDMARDENISFLGASRSICSPGGPFEGMSDISGAFIQGSEVERVAGIIQGQVLPALKSPGEAVKMAGYRVQPPSSAQYYIWPNDCHCCS